MKFVFKPIYYWFLLFATTSLAYQLVQDTIRPNYNGDNAVIIYLLGIAPNFLPAIGIPALFLILIPEISQNKTNIWLNERKYITAIIISLIGLLSWEFLQILTPSGRFDWNDILWTCIGSLIFYFIWVISPDTYKK
jgi:glycopeptide antibiotics resistance protein